jgi:hypothetical protein
LKFKEQQNEFFKERTQRQAEADEVRQQAEKQRLIDENNKPMPEIKIPDEEELERIAA